MSVKTKISAALIIRNAEKTAVDAVKSIINHVDEVVIVFAGKSTDKTEKLLRREYGRNKRIRFFDFEWVDDFAAARQFSFDQCTGEWILWMDADDTFETDSDLHKLAEFAAEAKLRQGVQVDSFSFPYFYARDKHGNYTSILTRDRLINRRIFTEDGAAWKYPIHEIIVIPGRKTQVMNANETGIGKFNIYHHSELTTENRHIRNTRLLLKQLKQYRNDPRSYMELGRHYFFNDKKYHKRAFTCYAKAATMELIPLDRYMVNHKLADISREFGDYDSARAYDHAAMLIFPEYADAYYGLAETEQLSGRPDKALSYIKAGDTTRPADSRLGFDPLDYTFDAHRIEATIHMSLGNWQEAKNHTEEALRYVPDEPTVLKMKLFIDEYLRREHISKAALMIAQDKETDLSSVAAGLPKYVFDPLEVRNAYHGVLHSRVKSVDIVIFCGPGLEEWHRPKMDKEGIGGSETAALRLFEMLKAHGYTVHMYASPGMYEGEGFYDYRRFTGDLPTKLFISWRRPWMINEQHAPIGKSVLWCHDLNYGPGNREDIMKYDYVAGMSYWHRDYLQGIYELPEEKMIVIPNGIDLARFDKEVERNPNKFVYSSSPERGLAELVELWPRIRRSELDELHVFYGFNNMEKLSKRDHSLVDYQNMLQAKIAQTPGIVMRGRVGQNELAEEFLSANMLLYPTNFLETSCITVMEAQAAGCIPITSHLGVLRENVALEIPLVAGNNRSTHYQKRFMSTVEFLRDNEENAEYLRVVGREFIQKNRLWGNTYDAVEDLLRGL